MILEAREDWGSINDYILLACSFYILVSEGFYKGLFNRLLEEGMVETFGKTVCWTVTVVNVKHVHTKHMNLWVSYFS